MGDSGIYSQKAIVDGVMPQSQEGDALDLLVGSPMRIERRRFKELAVAYGLPASIRNRLDFVDIYWPSAPAGPIAFDSFPARDDNTQMPGGRGVGEYMHSQAVRRRAALARQSIAYVFRHSGDEPLTIAHIQAAYRFVAEHRDDPAEPEASPLMTTTYERSQTAGVAMDEASGVGVRVRPAGVDTSEADEAARIARINAPPMYRDGEPIDKE